MSLSSKFISLEHELEKLRMHLLPAEFEQIEICDERTQIQTLAYLVLAHAEIEAYLEDRAWETALNSYQVWREQGKANRILLSIIAFSGCHLEPPPKTLTPQKGSKKWKEEKLDLDRKLQKAINAFHHVIRENHGLKEINILALLLPIGIQCEVLDSTWIATMNTFGEKRGQVAHTSGLSYRTQQPPDPKTEFDRISQILEGLKTIDLLINSLIQENQ
jgi:hypothetical protein